MVTITMQYFGRSFDSVITLFRNGADAAEALRTDLKSKIRKAAGHVDYGCRLAETIFQCETLITCS